MVSANVLWLILTRKIFQHDIGTFKYGLFTGYTGAVGWDPSTAHLVDYGTGPEQSWVVVLPLLS